VTNVLDVQHALHVLREVVDARVPEILRYEGIHLLLFLVDAAGGILQLTLEGPLETLAGIATVIHQVDARAALYALTQAPAMGTRAVSVGLCHPESETCLSWLAILDEHEHMAILAYDSCDDGDLMQWLDGELAQA
jgi:hypothetical protein